MKTVCYDYISHSFGFWSFANQPPKILLSWDSHTGTDDIDKCLRNHVGYKKFCMTVFLLLGKWFFRNNGEEVTKFAAIACLKTIILKKWWAQVFLFTWKV